MSGTKAFSQDDVHIFSWLLLSWIGRLGSYNFKTTTQNKLFSILIEMLIQTQQAYRLPDISIKRQVWKKVEGPQTKHKTHILKQLIKQLHM